MEFENLFNQQTDNKIRTLKTDLNNYTFSQKLSRTTDRIEMKQLSAEEKRSILDVTFTLGNKLLLKEGENVSDNKFKHGYNLRFIEIDFDIKIDNNLENIFSKKIA